MRSRFALALSALTLALVIPATALAADETGAAGRVKVIEINAPSADTYLQYHGRIIVAGPNKTNTEYRWGGTSCGSRTLSAELVQLLADITRDKSEIKLTPRFQDGQGSTKCLVGFSIQQSGGGGNDGNPPNPPS